MTKMKVPATAAEAKKTVGSLAGLLEDNSFSLGAILYAYPGVEWHKLGIRGLKQKSTVDAYRITFAEYVKAGTVADVKPGQSFTPPTDVDWKFSKNAPGGRDKRYVAKDPKAIARAILRGEVDLDEFIDSLPLPKSLKKIVRDQILAALEGEGDEEEDEGDEDDEGTGDPTGVYYDAMGKVHSGYSRFREAVVLFGQLDGMSAEQRHELAELLDAIAPVTDYLRSYTRANPRASLADEISEFLANT